MAQKPIAIYQVLPRLYGNTQENCVPNGSIEENGCGKLADFTLPRLRAIKKMGYTHIWYTGVIEHATQTDYSSFGIRQNHPQVVKGMAGSPYAIKDYYDIDPDLAISVPDRMVEFDALIKRTHQANLSVIIDFVPNHVAREYFSDSKPADIRDLGYDDQTDHAFDPQNNFYYIPNQAFDTSLLPRCLQTDTPDYKEFPAKASGNDVFSERPSAYDWYETVKLNYGVDYLANGEAHFDPIPDTWRKMLDILLFWASKDIDGFRCDMAEMVPADFWHYAIERVKEQFPDIVFIAEIYNPDNYRHYLSFGGFDYLYDKVGLYDTLRGITQGFVAATALSQCWQNLGDIRTQMLHFTENHDEQRYASVHIADSPTKALPAFVVCALFDTAPVMVYAGQELGEKGADAEGFSGPDGRTTIFDYWSVPTLRRNILGTLTEEELQLQALYSKIIRLKGNSVALREGEMYDLMYFNHSGQNGFDSSHHYLFLRATEEECVLVCTNFSDQPADILVQIPTHAFDFFHIDRPWNSCYDLLNNKRIKQQLKPSHPVHVTMPPYGFSLLRFRK